MFVQTTDWAVLDDLVIDLVYFVERSSLPTWKIGRHPMDFHDMTWILAGKATYWCDDVPYTVQAGDLLYLPRGCQRQAITDPDHLMHSLACNFQCSNVKTGAPSRLPFPPVSHIGFPENLETSYRRLNRVWLEKKPGHRLESRGLLSLILHQVAQAMQPRVDDSAQSRRLLIVQDYIFQHCYQPIPVGRLAELVHLTPGYFGTWFRQQTGLTIHGYLNRIRIRRASDLLSAGGFNVSEAAYKCGFEDLFHFSKVFKKITGVSPSSLLRTGAKLPPPTLPPT